MKRTALLLASALALAAGSASAAGQPKGPFAGAVHAVGALAGKDGSPISLTWDRGRITGLSSSSITLTRRDEAQVTFAITASTVVRNGGATYPLSDLKTGLVATVVSEAGDALVVRRIRGDGAPSGADPSAFAGPAAKAIDGTIDVQDADGSHATYDYDRGRIQSVGDLVPGERAMFFSQAGLLKLVRCVHSGRAGR